MGIGTTAENRLSRDSWLHQALEILRDEGIQGVRIDRVARDLGVTKGSFYWHFKDLHDLRQSVLRYWAERYSDVISENEAYLEGDPAEGLLAAMTRVREEGLDAMEIPMRSWADHDPTADQTVREVYERRTKFVRSFFTRLGFRGLDAEMRTRSILCFMSWEPSMYVDDSPGRRLKLLKRHLQLLTTK
jgi:AcrR family transcriptional regulator